MVPLGTHQSYSLLCFRHIFTSLFIFFFFFSLFCYFSGSSHSLLLVIYLLITPFNLGFHLLTLSPPSFYVFIYFEIHYYLFKYVRHLRTKPNKQALHRCTLKLFKLKFFLIQIVQILSSSPTSNSTTHQLPTQSLPISRMSMS